MRKETSRLQRSMRGYTGEDLSSIPYEDLDQLEQQLEHSVDKVRARKVLALNVCLFFFFMCLYTCNLNLSFLTIV